MEKEDKIVPPLPVLDEKETVSLEKLTERYEKLCKPGVLVKTKQNIAVAGKKAAEIVPQPVKDIGKTAGNALKGAKEIISEQELFEQCMKIVVEGFGVVERQAAKFAVGEKTILKKVNALSKDSEITSIEEICLARSYDIPKLVNKYRTQDLGWAFAEGGATGVFGFVGLPFNLVLSTFLYFRAVQSVAMYYGYDVKSDPAELQIASEVFMNSLSPNSQGTNEITGIVGKIMTMAEITTVKQLSRKTWEEMANHGGVALLLCQMRALANKSAKKALEKAGKKGLENSLFERVFQQIGKSLTKKTIGRMVPIAGAAVGALFDTAQMNTVLEYADVFYNKRFLLEKEVRINTLLGISKPLDSIVIEVPDEDVVEIDDFDEEREE